MACKDHGAKKGDSPMRLARGCPSWSNKIDKSMEYILVQNGTKNGILWKFPIEKIFSVGPNVVFQTVGSGGGAGWKRMGSVSGSNLSAENVGLWNMMSSSHLTP